MENILMKAFFICVTIMVLDVMVNILVGIIKKNEERKLCKDIDEKISALKKEALSMNLEDKEFFKDIDSALKSKESACKAGTYLRLKEELKNMSGNRKG